MSDSIEEILKLPHWRTIRCSNCGEDIRIHALQIHTACVNCGTDHKCRAYGGIGTEIQDTIDAVLEWAGDGDDFDAVMARRKEILDDKHAGDA
jgi:predicted RNA-binding Zn-ribbon protein involved in translation (DUF1610 family)